MATPTFPVEVITPEQRKAIVEALRAAANAIEDHAMLHQSGAMVVGPCDGGLGIKSNLVLAFATKH